MEMAKLFGLCHHPGPLFKKFFEVTMGPQPPPPLLQGREGSEAAPLTLLCLATMTAAGAAPLAAEAATAVTISGGTTAW
jgi:hypothetical protein